MLSPNNTVNKVLQYATVAANALQDNAVATHIPFLNSVCILSLTIIPIVQDTKFQKEQCLRIVKEMHQLLCVVMKLCIQSNDIRSPKMLHQIAQWALTLQKFQSCLRAQQELGTIKRLFKKSEITAQLDSCERELRATLEIFTMNNGVGIASTLVEFRTDTERQHQELLELISSQSEFFDSASSVSITTTQIHRSSLNTSSGSFSLLPPLPKIFHGRDSELKDLIAILHANPARVVILGPGGMGKTTLAIAALHHPTVIGKYSVRHFISCESANDCASLVTTIGLHLGLEPSGRLSKAVVQHLGQCRSCLVVLDNFETPWEPLESRGQVEEFLSLLADIPSVALMLTMRGAERPGKMKWTRPVLPPLKPLSLSASREIFFEVADEPSSEEESALDTLLHLSGSLPLAVSLMANIASFEGYSGTLARWQIENVTLLSDGHNKESNLEKSITLSLGSPCLSSSPHAKDLLALLSLLPDGIRAEDINASKVPIPDIRRWQSLLVGTSLAYIDVKGCLKALSPIREYIRRVHPAPMALYSPLRTYFQGLIDLWSSNRELPSGDLAPALVANLGNINELVLQSLLSAEESTLVEIGHSIIMLDYFSASMLKGRSTLLQQLPHLIKMTGDSGLRWKYTGRCIGSQQLWYLIENVEAVIEEGLQYFATGTRTPAEAVHFYREVAFYYQTRSMHKAKGISQLALSLARQSDDIELQLLSMETEFAIARRSDDPYWRLEVAQKAWKIARFASNYWQFRCTQWEAWGTIYTGNLPRTLDLCKHAEELLISDGMQGSERYLAVLDLRADVHFFQTNYIEARHILKQIVDLTPSTYSSLYHGNSLSMIAYIDILTGCEVAEILENLTALCGT